MPSIHKRFLIASPLFFPQAQSVALNPEQTRGLVGESKILHCSSSVKWMHLIFAGFPSGIPGSGDEIDGIIQHAPQLGLHSK
jgi:hypothetical protein